MTRKVWKLETQSYHLFAALVELRVHEQQAQRHGNQLHYLHDAI